MTSTSRETIAPRRDGGPYEGPPQAHRYDRVPWCLSSIMQQSASRTAVALIAVVFSVGLYWLILTANYWGSPLSPSILKCRDVPLKPLDTIMFILNYAAVSLSYVWSLQFFPLVYIGLFWQRTICESNWSHSIDWRGSFLCGELKQ